MEEYKVISATNKDELIERVNDWLSLGWRVQGGVSVHVGVGIPCIYDQAIIKIK